MIRAAVDHFFPGFNAWLDRIEDPRRQDMITYSVRHLVWEAILMFLSGAQSRNQMVCETLRAGFHRTLLDFAGTDEEAAAHPDTVYWLLAKLDPNELVKFSARMMKRLFRMRCLERFRFGREWLVTVDATWLRVYPEQHCEHCLHQNRPDGSVVWFHAVLEAKLTLGNGLSFSLASVPIENPGGEYDKQDCELKAFERLAARIKQLYPRLPICILGDSLYACDRVLEICEQMNWSFILTFKEGRTPDLWKRAVKAAARNPELLRQRSDGAEQRLRWAVMLKHRSRHVHAVFCTETRPDGEVARWAWLTDHRPDRNNVETIANKGGRLRQTIEQQFNVQKNGEFRLKHDYGSNANAWYNYYLSAQIADVVLQLIQETDLVNRLSNGVHRTFAEAFRTIRNFISRVRESIHRDRISPEWSGHAARRIQIRFRAPP